MTANDIVAQMSGYFGPKRREGLQRESKTQAAFPPHKGLEEPAGNEDSNGERHPTLVRSTDSYGFVVGVDIGGSNLRVALAGLSGKVIDRSASRIKEACSPTLLVQEILRCVEYLLERNSISRSSLLALGAGAPGVTDVESGIVIATSYLRAWRNVPLRDLLESALQIPALVENDVNLAAIGEHWMGAARGIHNFVFLAIGTGIGAGIFLNGHMFHGPDWTAGELGYMLVPGTPDIVRDRDEPGSLESMIGGKGIELQWQHACQNDGDLLLQNLTATEIFDRAQTGDHLAQNMLDQSSRLLSYAVLNTSLIVNCSLFVLGGGVGMSKPLYNATQHILDQRNELVRPHLVQSILGLDAQLMGAIRLALDKAESLIAIPQ